MLLLGTWIVYFHISGIPAGIDAKAWIKPGIITLLIPVGYSLLKKFQRVLELRPTPLERSDRIKRLAKAIFKDTSEGPPLLREFQLKKKREFRVAITPELIRTMTLLNFKLFARSVHGQSFDEKLRRNLAHFQKNSHAVWLLGMNPSGIAKIRALNAEERETLPEDERLEWVGFSHILPISKSTYLKYTRSQPGEAGIEDVNFSAEYVCERNERAYAFLIFTLAIDPKLIRRWEFDDEIDVSTGVQGIYRRSRSKLFHFQKVERLLYNMAFQQVLNLAEHHIFEYDCIILAQAFGKRAGETLEAFGFTRKTTTTADGETLYEKKVRVHERNVQAV